MPAPPPPESVTGADDAGGVQSDGTLKLQLHAEALTVAKKVRRTVVRVAASTSAHEEVVEADLEQVRVIVERVPVGKVVYAVPPVRVEGDVTILPVVEEELVLVKRLVLKEEVHLRTVRTSSRHVESVTLRKQDVDITRTPLD